MKAMLSYLWSENLDFWEIFRGIYNFAPFLYCMTSRYSLQRIFNVNSTLWSFSGNFILYMSHFIGYES